MTYLETIRSRIPDLILRARLEFEREYRSSGGEGMFSQEIYPWCVSAVGKRRPRNGKVALTSVPLLSFIRTFLV